MYIGASTANFYPALTENALDAVLELGFKHTEIFFNAVSELEPSFTKRLKEKADDAGAVITAIHPHTSFMEPYFLFSVYRRRADEMLDNYKRNFEAAAALGASYVVLHGDRENSPLPLEESLDRFEELYELGISYGVRVAQENVVRFRSASLDYLRALRERLGDRAAFVLDIKQTVRCNHTVEEVADAMRGHIVHVHVSDHDNERDCLPPGQGTFDYARLFSLLREQHYHGALMIELYRKGFENGDDLVRAATVLRSFV